MSQNQEVCRFCLKNYESELRNLKLQPDLIEKIEVIFFKIQLKINPENEASMMICYYCSDFINNFYEFYESVRKNHDDFLTATEKSQAEISFQEQNISPQDTDKDLKRKDDELNIESEVIDYCHEPLSDAEFNLNEEICDDEIFKSDIKNTKKEIKKIPSYRKVPSQKELIISCPLCPSHALKLKNEKILKLHLAEHANFDRIDENRVNTGQSPLLRCPNCERRFASDSELKSHLDNHQRNAFMTCELCGRTTVAANLSAHLQNHFKRYFCEFCSLVSKSRYDLEKHIKRKHSGPQFYECAHCNKKLKRKKLLEKHIRTCLGPGRSRVCPHCGVVFESFSKRKKHINLVHIGYNCRICDIALSSQYQYKKHILGREHKEKSLEKKLSRANAKPEAPKLGLKLDRNS
uniref:CSON011836 protein n=1 Tax=Culicoides sonorensis TaxID=179676 RepID=A0A336M423_CULSO